MSDIVIPPGFSSPLYEAEGDLDQGLASVPVEESKQKSYRKILKNLYGINAPDEAAAFIALRGINPRFQSMPDVRSGIPAAARSALAAQLSGTKQSPQLPQAGQASIPSAGPAPGPMDPELEAEMSPAVQALRAAQTMRGTPLSAEENATFEANKSPAQKERDLASALRLEMQGKLLERNQASLKGRSSGMPDMEGKVTSDYNRGHAGHGGTILRQYDWKKARANEYVPPDPPAGGIYAIGGVRQAGPIPVEKPQIAGLGQYESSQPERSGSSTATVADGEPAGKPIEDWRKKWRQSSYNPSNQQPAQQVSGPRRGVTSVQADMMQRILRANASPQAKLFEHLRTRAERNKIAASQKRQERLDLRNNRVAASERAQAAAAIKIAQIQAMAQAASRPQRAMSVDEVQAQHLLDNPELLKQSMQAELQKKLLEAQAMAE